MEGEDVSILDPIHIQVDESFLLSDNHLRELAKNRHEVDLYIFNAGVSEIYLEFAQRYKKPMIVFGGCLNTMSTAALLARGLEIHPCQTMDDLPEIVQILRVRKAPAMIDSFVSLSDVTAKFGTRFRFYNIHEFFDQIYNVAAGSNPTTPGKNEPNITNEDEIQINAMTEALIKGTEDCHMSYEEIYPSMKAHYLVQKLLEKTDCNAFTAPCFDICATRRFNEERFTFCLNHSLNNENGIPSACEFDTCATLSMVVLSNFAKAAPYMGNTIPNPIESGMLKGFGARGLLNPEAVDAVIPELEDNEPGRQSYSAGLRRPLRPDH